MKCHPVYLALLGITGLVFALQEPIKTGTKALLGKAQGKRTTAGVVAELGPKMAERFTDLKSLTDGRELAIVAFKEEERVELWKAPAGKGKAWRLVKTWPFTATCGALGPKLREGDRQIPEGLYQIEYLNPNSSYHLSMKIDYPNAFDRSQAKATKRKGPLGGDIMIHGSQVTIGCIPIGDPGIEELFYLVAENGYRNTRVIIAPIDFRARPKEKPQIDSVDWEEKLYAQIRAALVDFTVEPQP